MMKTFHTTHNERRGAFTLIELIVVMGIIAVLAGMVITAVATFVSNARTGATETLVIKIDRLIASRREAFDRFIIRSDKRAGAGIPEYMTNAGDRALFNSGQQVLAKTLARKRWYRQAFPQTYAEAGLTPPTGHLPQTESAEMLYYCLTNSVQFGDEPVGTADFGPGEVVDADNDGYPEFVDAWGNPLRFYRWPTRLIRPQNAGSEETEQSDIGPPGSSPDTIINPQNNSQHEYALFLINSLPRRAFLGVDPDDEFGVIVAAINDTNPPFDKLDAAWFERNFHTAETWSVPLVISAGPDGELGLYEPNDVTANSTKSNIIRLAQPKWNQVQYLEDNISNQFLRTGGR